jgi:hypothetical protein
MAFYSDRPDLSTAQVIQALQDSGRPLQEWGRSIDNQPLLSVRCGGDRQPPIFITAGAHCTETAGVHAALNLLHMLDTEFEVHIFPLRDPFGFAGDRHCLSYAAGEQVEVSSHTDSLEYLQTHAQPVWREGETQLFLLGEIGFAWTPPELPGVTAFTRLHSRMLSLAQEDPLALQALRGKRVMLMQSMPDVEGTGETGRCWHALVTGKGEWMHLNRLFGREDAPAEVAAVDRLMQTYRPGLTLDLHEGNGQGFWMPVNKHKEPERVFTMTQAFFGYVNERGYPITSYEEWAATDATTGKNYTPDWLLPEPRVPGMFWMNGLGRGEGYNCMDYGALFGIGYGTESPMERPLAMRVDAITNGILAAMRVWENTEA